ncbi:EVE domain-containing protein [Bacillus swezeyi]|uniref:EVE domain-containing protein n=1 Tax=Bacillus swezeyi TaxID=1925020 RepID=UPI0039C76006
MKTKYWIGVASRDHVLMGVSGGFAQLCHGKEAPLKRMNPGDWIIYYSPKQNLKDQIPYQKFTAIGKVADDSVYKFDAGEGFTPYRRKIDFLKCLETSIHPFIPSLSFIKNKKHWGYSFRFGHTEISEQDFNLIFKQMIKI